MELNNLPASGIWTLTRYPGTVTSIGSGSSTIITGLPEGIYNFTVTNEEGCLSVPSANVVIPPQPIIPTVPLIGTITQPSYPSTTGSAILYGLPATGEWMLTRSSDGATLTGSGPARTVPDLPPGEYTFHVTNSSGCSSGESESVIIMNLEIPVLKITDPSPVCSPETVDLLDPEITKGSTPGLFYTFWTDPEGAIVYDTPETAGAGTYFIKGINQAGYFDIKPVIMQWLSKKPVAYAGPDQVTGIRV